jgi:hypothetical protein
MSVMSKSSGADGTAPCVCHTAPNAFCSGWKVPCAATYQVGILALWRSYHMVCRWFRPLSKLFTPPCLLRCMTHH